MWRRIAGGLVEERHADIWRFLRPQLERRFAPDQPKRQPKLKGIQPEGLEEMVRLAAALEHLDSSEKITLGDWIAPRVTAPGPWAWALGRVGARVPLYGSAHRTVDLDHEDWKVHRLSAVAAFRYYRIENSERRIFSLPLELLSGCELNGSK